MHGDTLTVLGAALARSIADVRAGLRDPTAAVGVVVPSDVTGVLLRQQLALAGPFIRVEFLTPERLVRDLARPHTPDGWALEPTAWLPTVVGVVLQRLAETDALGRHGEALRQPGWHRPVARAVERLESAGIGPAELRGDATRDERAQVLAAVLHAVKDRRARDHLLALPDVCSLARESLAHGGHGPGHRVAGAVLVGDRILSPDVFEVLRTWLGTRPHRVLNPPPLSQLDPAPRGLRAAASGPTDPVLAAGSDALATVQQRLYRQLDCGPVALDPSLAVVTTPDEVRDVAEATREVLRAIRDGVPLDRIAIVLPDTLQAEVLQHALDRAGVPATWLTGPSLLRTPEARGLLLAADLATGDDTVRQWYALLSHPGLNLRRALGADSTAGRGRWRRILAGCGAVRGTRAIFDAVRRWSATLEADADDDRRAANTLTQAISALDSTFATWRERSTLGAHGQHFALFTSRWWRPSSRRDRVAMALSDWGAPGTGFRIPLSRAVVELRDTLKRAADLDGKLTEPRVRVVSPMLCLGGAFERVCVTGLTQKRLPTEIREDPLLPDALLDSLAAKHGVTLLNSRVLAEFEDRRFAAVVGACTGRLWLASPELEMLSERPLLPSTHLLAVQSVLSGRRAGFVELRRTTVRCGSRAQPFPADPDDAIGALEYQIAAARREPVRSLSDLAVRADTRRLLALQRALDADLPTPWTGRISRALLHVAGLDDDELLPASHLRALLIDPADFFFRRILGAWSARDLPDLWDPCHPYTVGDSVRAAIEVAVEAGDPCTERTLAAWDVALAKQAANNPHVGPADLTLARRLAEGAIAAFQLKAGELKVEVPELDGLPFSDLPWRVDASGAWVAPDGAIALRVRKPTKAGLPVDAAIQVLAGLLAHQQGVPVRRVEIYDGSGASMKRTLVDCAQEVHERAALALALVRAGWLPWTTSSRYGPKLKGERGDDPWSPERAALVLGEDAP